MTTSRRRGISPLLIAAAALLLGVLAYGFTASATVTNGNNLSGGRGNSVAVGFNVETSSVNYSLTGGAPNAAGQVNEVSFNATPPTGATSEFSPNVQLFVRANVDGITGFNSCPNSNVSTAPSNNQFSRISSTLIQANRCIFTAIPVNASTFGLDVIVVE